MIIVHIHFSNVMFLPTTMWACYTPRWLHWFVHCNSTRCSN